MKQPASLPLSWPLLTWLRQAPDWRALPARHRLQMTWQAWMGSVNAGLSTKLDSTLELHDPILVLGLWRSGTTAMHELLVGATGLPCPRTWHCMKAPVFRLLGKGRDAGHTARPMDGLPVGADTPQEDEFALLSLGVDSAYRGFLQPRRLDTLHHTLDPQHWLDHRDWLAPFGGFLRAVSAAEGQVDRPLVLKSPNHSFRLPALLRAFPSLKIVWMCRDPSSVLQSNQKMWRSMMQRYALGDRDDRLITPFLLLAMQRTADLITSTLLELPTTQLAVCRQEDLLDKPLAELERVTAQLGLPCSANALSSTLERIRQGRVERHAPVATTAALLHLTHAQEALLSRGAN